MSKAFKISKMSNIIRCIRYLGCLIHRIIQESMLHDLKSSKCLSGSRAGARIAPAYMRVRSAIAHTHTYARAGILRPRARTCNFGFKNRLGCFWPKYLFRGYFIFFDKLIQLFFKRLSPKFQKYYVHSIVQTTQRNSRWESLRHFKNIRFYFLPIPKLKTP